MHTPAGHLIKQGKHFLKIFMLSVENQVLFLFSLSSVKVTHPLGKHGYVLKLYSISIWFLIPSIFYSTCRLCSHASYFPWVPPRRQQANQSDPDVFVSLAASCRSSRESKLFPDQQTWEIPAVFSALCQAGHASVRDGTTRCSNHLLRVS